MIGTCRCVIRWKRVGVAKNPCTSSSLFFVLLCLAFVGIHNHKAGWEGTKAQRSYLVAPLFGLSSQKRRWYAVDQGRKLLPEGVPTTSVFCSLLLSKGLLSSLLVSC
ncbi:hypothetical protein VTI28DRAFT_9787 [Corynascus sepedonium]